MYWLLENVEQSLDLRNGRDPGWGKIKIRENEDGSCPASGRPRNGHGKCGICSIIFYNWLVLWPGHLNV